LVPNYKIRPLGPSLGTNTWDAERSSGMKRTLCLVSSVLLEASCLQSTMSPAIEGGCGLRAREMTRTGRSVLSRSRISKVPTASQGHAATFQAARRDTAPECALYVSQEVQRLKHSIICIWGRCRTVLRGAIVYAAVLLALFFCGPAIARANVNLDAECTPDVAGLQTYTEPVRFCETPTPLSGCTSIRFLQVHENTFPPLHTYA